MARGLCAPPVLDTAGWRIEQLQGVTIRVPKGYGSRYSDADMRLFAAGERVMGVAIAPGPHFITEDHDVVLQGTCRAMISGRPAEVAVHEYANADRPMQPSGRAGVHYVVVATWIGALAGRDVAVWMVTQSRRDFALAHRLLWTTNIPMPKPATTAESPTTTSAPTCVTAPLPAPDAMVDTALVGMLASGSPVPSGVLVLALTFEPSGELARMEVRESDLLESHQRQLAVLVSSNLRPYEPTWPSTIVLRVTSAGGALTYATMPATACTPAP
jgi:hypothetical protein